MTHLWCPGCGHGIVFGAGNFDDFIDRSGEPCETDDCGGEYLLFTK